MQCSSAGSEGGGVAVGQEEESRAGYTVWGFAQKG